jgi:hypothetical protein
MTENSDEAEAINLDRPFRLHGGLEDSRAVSSLLSSQEPRILRSLIAEAFCYISANA